MQAHPIFTSKMPVSQKSGFHTEGRQETEGLSPSIHFGALNPADGILLDMLNGVHTASIFGTDQEAGDRMVRESLNTLAEMSEADPTANGTAFDLAKQLYRAYVAGVLNSANPSLVVSLEGVLPKLLAFKEGKYTVASEIVQAPIRYFLKETKHIVDRFYEKLNQ